MVAGHRLRTVLPAEGVRVSEEEEMQGLDISEHGIQLALNAPTTFSSPSLREPGVLATSGSRFLACYWGDGVR